MALEIVKRAVMAIQGKEERDVTVIKPGDIGGTFGTEGVVVSAREYTAEVREGGGRFKKGKAIVVRIGEMRVQTPAGSNPIAFIEFKGQAPVDRLGEHQVAATMQGTIFFGRVAGSATLSKETIVVRRGE